MPHDYGHAHMDRESGDRRVSIANWVNALLTVAQIVGGILSGSLALIADALHNFSDMASPVIPFVARKIARRPADEWMTFGYGRIETVAALINYTTLILVGIPPTLPASALMSGKCKPQAWTSTAPSVWAGDPSIASCVTLPGWARSVRAWQRA